VQFDFIGVSFRDKDSDSFQNYFIDMAEVGQADSEEKLTPQETLHLAGLRTPRTCAEINERNGAVLCPATSDLEKALCSLHLCPTVDDGTPQTWRITFGSRQFDTYSSEEVRFVSEVAGYIALGVRRRVEFGGVAAGDGGTSE